MARFNRRHQLCGHLFSGRYKALVVDGRGNGYLRTVCDYVHLNPARAKLLTPQQPLREYRWSSWPEYLKSPRKRWPWLRVERLLGEYRIPQDSAAGRRRLAEALEARRGAEAGAAYAPIRQGWFLGQDRLRAELLAQVSQRAGPNHYGEAVQASAVAQAEGIVQEELRLRGWTEAALGVRRKGDPEKVQIAQRLRRDTTVTLAWITGRLRMGTKTHLAHLLYWRERGGKKHETMD